MGKTANMAGQDISFANKLRGMVQTFNLYRRGFFENPEKEVGFHRELVDIFRENTGKDVAGARVLDLGCGQTAHETAMWLGDGADIDGLDVEVPTFEMGLGGLIRVVKANGLERGVKSAVRHYMFDRRFFAELGKVYGKPLPFNELKDRVHIMSATDMSFEDNTFDYIYSRNVFEHIDDVPRAVSEVNRVLRPDGVAWVSLHLFTSLTGGHNMEWLTGDENQERDTPPWDHLRENRYPANFYLNRHRMAEFRAFFNEELNVVEEVRLPERIDPMTPEIEAELTAKGYAMEELQTRVLGFLCRKKQQ